MCDISDLITLNIEQCQSNLLNLTFLDENIYDTNTNILLYESKVSQVFDIEDGGSLDIDCSRAYYSETEAATDRMLIRINEVITDQFCGIGIASAVAKTQTFFGMENQV